ncbi:MAG TPA: hypothetical protein VK607_06615 [Kofleriaceae bacterium]|nr:hypothetical protein [Kofleriaceae bacterium]
MRLYAALFAVGLVVYGLVAWDRVLRPSADPHFVYQADAWLHGRAAIDPPPPAGDDWAQVETVVLDDGTTASGRRLITRPVFRTLGGDELPAARIRRSLGATAYVSFPPFPSLVMLPSAALAGRAGNDVIPTLLIAALILPLALLVLRRLAAAGLSPRSLRDDLWLVAALAFGSVLWFSAVQGRVWYTAHVVGVALALVYAWASIEARRPVIAGLALGAAALTRTAMAFMVPLLVCEAWRVHGGLAAWRADRRAMLRALRRPLVQFAIPLAGFAIAGMVYNLVRFGAPTEFGHSYLHVRQQAQIEQYGLASYHYLARNLAVAFTLLPELTPRAPFVQISGHGLALWFTTPVLVLVLWPRDRGPLHRPLWLCVAAVALPSLVYQNSGWVQFGYRFGLDYLALLIMLVAVGGRPLTRAARALIVAGIAINLFGAITFDRAWQYYRVGGNSYDVIVAH